MEKTMKAQKFVRVLILLAIWGTVMLPVPHLIAESTEKKTEATETTEENSESTETSINVEVGEETEEKLKEVLDKVNEAVKGIEELNTDGILNKREIDVDVLLEKLKEHSKSLKDIEGVKVEISEPTVIIDSSDESEELKELKEKIKKLVEDGNFDSDEIAKQLKELVDDMKIVKAAARGGEIVTVLQYGPDVTTRVLKDVKGNKELLVKIKELASDEKLESDELIKKVQDLVKDSKMQRSVILDKDNVKVYRFGPHVTTKMLKNIKDFKELGEEISKLAENEDLDSDELAKKVLELVKDATFHINSDIIRGKIRSVPLELSKSLIETNDSSIERLEKRIGKLETKIDNLIEKLSKIEPESSESK